MEYLGQHSKALFSDGISGTNKYRQWRFTPPMSTNEPSEITAGIKSLVGGEIKGMTKLRSELREELLWELKEKAENILANAVVGLR